MYQKIMNRNAFLRYVSYLSRMDRILKKNYLVCNTRGRCRQSAVRKVKYFVVFLRVGNIYDEQLFQCV